jgi:hypothetical protein
LAIWRGLRSNNFAEILISFYLQNDTAKKLNKRLFFLNHDAEGFEHNVPSQIVPDLESKIRL